MIICKLKSKRENLLSILGLKLRINFIWISSKGTFRYYYVKKKEKELKYSELWQKSSRQEVLSALKAIIKRWRGNIKQSKPLYFSYKRCSHNQKVNRQHQKLRQWQTFINKWAQIFRKSLILLKTHLYCDHWLMDHKNKSFSLKMKAKAFKG